MALGREELIQWGMWPNVRDQKSDGDGGIPDELPGELEKWQSGHWPMKRSMPMH